MKTIVFMTLLAAAGCSKKTADCDASIGQGMDRFAASAKATDPAMHEARLNVISKLRGTLTQRCNEDKWPAEVTTCFATVSTMKEMQACQTKLSDEQRAKLMTEVRQAMMGSAGGMRMPPNMPGHPPALGSGGSPGAVPGADPAGSAAPPAGAAAPPAAAPPAAAPPASATPPTTAAGSAAPAAGAGGW
jgi:hypothetical protein